MIDERLVKQLNDIGEKIVAINKIILFGSRAIGDHKEKSDIDLAFVAPDMTQKEWAAFTFDIEEELDTLLFVEMIKYEGAPEEVKNEIMKYGKVIYSAPADDHELLQPIEYY